MQTPAPTKAALATPERILVIRHRFIGDTLLMLPMLTALRQLRPNAHITVLTAPDSAPLLTHMPLINAQWVFGVSQSAEGKPIKTFWQAVQAAKAAHFTAALVLKRSFSSAALAFFAGIPVRVGYATEGRSPLLTHPLPYPDGVHEAECFRHLLAEYLGCLPRQLPALSWPAGQLIHYAPDEPAQMQLRWQQTVAPAFTQHIAVHIGASNSGKQWPLAHFAAFAQAWLTQSPHRCLHVMGGPGDRETAQQLNTLLPEALLGQVIVWAGELSLRQTAWVLQQVHVVVTSDSGLSHLAAAVGTPVRVIFGPTNPLKWHPLGQHHHVITASQPLPCQPCNLKIKCTINYACLSNVTPAQVLATLPMGLNTP
jgi:heptosyltransferase II